MREPIRGCAANTCRYNQSLVFELHNGRGVTVVLCPRHAEVYRRIGWKDVEK